jgi:Double-GTPase 2
MTDGETTPNGDDELEAALREAREVGVEPARSHALTDQEATRLAAEQRPAVVLFAGGVKSGKTTLITSFYERFSRGPLSSTRFAGSRTLPGFEARARGLRPQVGAKPPMPHTHRDAVPWLHLRVMCEELQALDLVFGDFDGEIFDGLVEGSETADQVPALKRADHISIVLDGGALILPVERQFARQRTLDLVGVVARPGVVSSPEALSLVVTKLDLLNGAEASEREAAREVIAEVRSRLASEAGVSPEVLETAAISEDPNLPVGHGLEALLSYWQRHPSTSVAGREVSPVPHRSDTWFGRFGS